MSRNGRKYRTNRKCKYNLYRRRNKNGLSWSKCRVSRKSMGNVWRKINVKPEESEENEEPCLYAEESTAVSRAGIKTILVSKKKC